MNEVTLKRLEETRENLQKTIEKNAKDIENQIKQIKVEEKSLAELKIKQSKNDNVIKEQTLLNKEYSNKLKTLQSKIITIN